MAESTSDQCFNAQMLLPQLESGIEALEERIPKRTNNFEVVRNVISRNRNRLFDQQGTYYE